MQGHIVSVFFLTIFFQNNLLKNLKKVRDKALYNN